MRIGIKAARDEAGLKQTELAKILKVSVNTYIDWEKERKPLPSEEKAAFISSVAEYMRLSSTTVGIRHPLMPSTAV